MTRMIPCLIATTTPRRRGPFYAVLTLAVVAVILFWRSAHTEPRPVQIGFGSYGVVDGRAVAFIRITNLTTRPIGVWFDDHEPHRAALADYQETRAGGAKWSHVNKGIRHLKRVDSDRVMDAMVLLPTNTQPTRIWIKVEFALAMVPFDTRASRFYRYLFQLNLLPKQMDVLVPSETWPQRPF